MEKFDWSLSLSKIDEMYSNMEPFDENEKYLLWAQETKHPLLTGTQKEFAEFLFKNESEITKIGNLETVFSDVRYWCKNRKK